MASIGGFILLLVIAMLLPRFFALIEAKPGMRLNDPVLELIGPEDVSAITFAILYTAVLGGMIVLLLLPYRFVRMMHAYAFLLLFRMITMFLVTLEAPATIIPLIDPITQIFYPADVPFLKDLFFSGHTATAVLFALAVGGHWARWPIGMGAALVGSLVILQHVHYSIDVLAAPFFATLAWACAKFSMERCGVKERANGYFDRLGRRFR